MKKKANLLDIETGVKQGDPLTISSQYRLKLNAEMIKFMSNRFVNLKSIKAGGAELEEVGRNVYLDQMINMTKGIEEEISRSCALHGKHSQEAG